jgi:protein-disulfide isomerase
MSSLRIRLAALLLAFGTTAGAQQPPSAADSARADLALIRRADASRTRGLGPGGVIDTLRPTIHVFVDHACPSCRAFTLDRGDSLAQLARTAPANLVIRVSPIPGLLRGAHAAEAAFCAGALGGASAFDRMHTRLLAQQDDWRFRRDPSETFHAFAKAIDLDSAEFTGCLARGATRPLVLGDARLAGQLTVEGTPTLVITRGSSLGASVRVVGEASMARVQGAINSATAPAVDEPSAYALLGRWRVDSIAVFRWSPDTSTEFSRALDRARESVAKTQADIRSGALVIETVFDQTLRYAHTLHRGDQIAYREAGAWTVPGLTGRVHTMTERGEDGTYHLSRLVARSPSALVLERHFVSGDARGTAERIYLRLQASGQPSHER